ncbi:hypothetical protein TELCIR_08801, partial [Teladorsagia circumcincta]
MYCMAKLSNRVLFQSSGYAHINAKSNEQMSYVSRLFPPYYKYAVFVFVGFQFLYCAFVLAI